MRDLEEIKSNKKVSIREIGDDGGWATVAFAGSKNYAIVIFSWGAQWDHVSMSYNYRSPTWDEMCQIWQKERRLEAGDRWQDTGFVFTTWNGIPMHPDTISAWFTDFVRRNNLPEATIHSLRHTNITLMIAAGVPLRTVARRGGHAQTSTTSNIYAHAIQSVDELAADAIADILKPMIGVRGR